jgi:hypothetical protein
MPLSVLVGRPTGFDAWRSLIACPPTKPFSTIREAILKQTKRRLDPTSTMGIPMLAEKFLLILETLLKSNNQSYADGAPRVISTSPHVPVKLPAGK